MNFKENTSSVCCADSFPSRGSLLRRIAFLLLLCFVLTGCAKTPTSAAAVDQGEGITVRRGEFYDQVEEVAEYLVTFGELPDNYVTKSEAKKHGWEGGSVEPYLFEGACIGGDRFGNYEGLLPEEESYRECDIDTIGKKGRGAKRLVYTEDITVIYFTEDHYDSFTIVYEEDV